MYRGRERLWRYKDTTFSIATGLENVEPILEAITHKYPLKMCYKPFTKDEFTCNIHPYHLRQHNRRWFVFAYSEDRKGILNFPLDRIIKLKHLSKSYIETDIDFDEYFDDIVGVTNYRNNPVEKVVLKISKKVLIILELSRFIGLRLNLKSWKQKAILLFN